MHQGRLLQVGSPREIYESPQSAFVAAFIGVSNSLVGRLETRDGRGLLRATGLPEGPALSLAGPAGVADGSLVRLVLRPERLHLSTEVHLPGYDNVLPARVRKATYNGGEMQYDLALSDALSWQARVANTGRDHKRFLPGESLFVRWKAEDAVVLPE